MPVKKIIFSLFIVFQALTSFSQFDGMKAVSDPSKIKEKLRLAADKTNDIYADFIQEKNLSVLSEKIESKGSFRFKKENMVRWAYTSPFKYVIVMNMGKIYINDDGKEKEYDVKNNKMFREINKVVLGTVRGNLFENADYQSDFFENEKYYLVKMRPVSDKMREFLNEIELYLDKNDFTVARMIMNEKGGDFTLVNFINKKVNGGLPDSDFQFK